MTDRPANYIEFDKPTEPDTEPLDVEQSYQLYHSLRTANDTDGVADFLSRHVAPFEFLAGYGQWKASQPTMNPTPEQIEEFKAFPMKPGIVVHPTPDGGVPHYSRNFVKRDQAGNPILDEKGNYLEERDGMGNLVVPENGGLGDAAYLFNQRKKQGGPDYR